MNSLLEKKFAAGAAIGANLIVKFGADDDTVIVAAAATDSLLGVVHLGPASGEPVDVMTHGIADVIAGGAITRGALVTSDAAGKAVAAAPGAGVNNRVLGVAMRSAVANDIIPVLLQPGSIQG